MGAALANDKSNKEVSLQRLIRKSTSLVVVACLTSICTLGIGAVVRGFALLIPIDVTVNVICVWLMFSFTNQVWKRILKYLCCCCYCYVFKEEFDESVGLKLRSWTASFTNRDSFFGLSSKKSTQSVAVMSDEDVDDGNSDDMKNVERNESNENEGDNENEQSVEIIVSHDDDMEVLNEGDDGLITKNCKTTIGSLVVGSKVQVDDSFISELTT